MNKKGQALVEFIIVIPIILMILFAIIDFGLIFYNKNKLESKLNDTVNMISNGDSDDKIRYYLNEDKTDNIKYEINNNQEYKTVEIYTNLNLITPGLNKILKSPYKVSVKRVIYE